MDLRQLTRLILCHVFLFSFLSIRGESQEMQEARVCTQTRRNKSTRIQCKRRHVILVENAFYGYKPVGARKRERCEFSPIDCKRPVDFAYCNGKPKCKVKAAKASEAFPCGDPAYRPADILPIHSYLLVEYRCVRKKDLEEHLIPTLPSRPDDFRTFPPAEEEEEEEVETQTTTTTSPPTTTTTTSTSSPPTTTTTTTLPTTTTTTSTTTTTTPSTTSPPPTTTTTTFEATTEATSTEAAVDEVVRTSGPSTAMLRDTTETPPEDDEGDDDDEVVEPSPRFPSDVIVEDLEKSRKTTTRLVVGEGGEGGATTAKDATTTAGTTVAMTTAEIGTTSPATVATAAATEDTISTMAPTTTTTTAATTTTTATTTTSTTTTTTTTERSQRPIPGEKYIGSALEPRKRRDVSINPTHVMPSMRITSPGRIVGWRIFATLPGEIFMQIWRPSGQERCQFQFVGQHLVRLKKGLNEVRFPRYRYFRVLAGDTIGWTDIGQGNIGYSSDVSSLPFCSIQNIYQHSFLHPILFDDSLRDVYETTPRRTYSVQVILTRN